MQKSEEWIKFPTTEQQVQKAKADWARRFSIPFCIGALDCTHVVIQKPSAPHGDDYVNRKQRPSLNVQATCDANEVFTSVDASWPGSVLDSRIWKNSEEAKFMATTKDTLLIADSGYGIAPWLITPFENPNTPEAVHFNKVYAKDRVIIERCFGQLKRRFPILQYKVRVQLKNVSKIIISCVVLHNVAKFLNDSCDSFQDAVAGDNDDETIQPQAPEQHSASRLRNLGQQKRAHLSALF